MAYFGQDTIDFLFGIRFNNNKEWFAQNKENYNISVKKPMDDFAHELCALINKELKAKGLDTGVVPVASRINRDIRFSKDKSPYRDHKWVSFKPETVKRWQDAPVFYFDIYPENFGYGMGYYMAAAGAMEAYRSAIRANIAAFERIAADFDRQKSFTLIGDLYKTKHSLPEAEHIESWYKRKDIAAVCRKELDNGLFSDGLAEMVMEGYKSLMDLYIFMIKAAGII